MQDLMILPRDFPIDTNNIAQIGIMKNPTSVGSTAVFTENQYLFTGTPSSLLELLLVLCAVGDQI